jgi:CubicO group peptidase (beta-lactamase class C family)
LIGELRHTIAEIVQRQQTSEGESFSGVCLVTCGEEEVFHRAFGLAHRGFNVPNTTTTRFDIASITKTFTA